MPLGLVNKPGECGGFKHTLQLLTVSLVYLMMHTQHQPTFSKENVLTEINSANVPSGRMVIVIDHSLWDLNLQPPRVTEFTVYV